MIVFRVFFQTVVFAVRQMLSNKIRSLLTMLGIIIGVFAIAAVIAAAGGLRGYVLDEFEKFGATKMFLWGERPDEIRDRVHWRDIRITEEETELLREHADTIGLVSITGDETVTLRYEDVVKQGVRVSGIEPDWHEIEQRFVTAGRTFSMSDDEAALQVCLVNDLAIDELRLANGGVGEYVLLNDRRFLVVGVVETKELSPMFGGDDARTEVYVPFSSIYRLDDFVWTRAVLQMTSPEVADEAEAQVRALLRKHRQLPGEWPDTFGVFQMTEAVDQFNAMAKMLGLVAAILVSISLAVGGVGIMNIMLVSVSERTREIGLRKALGANPLVILMQFLVEAVILCVIGGLLGLILAQAAVLGAQAAAPDNAVIGGLVIPWWAIVLSFGFCGFVGVVFGMFPAVKAARLDPIEALRHE